jgi:hypothetical protein
MRDDLFLKEFPQGLPEYIVLFRVPNDFHGISALYLPWYFNWVYIAFAVMEDQSPGLIPQSFVHVAVKCLYFAGLDAILSRGHERVDACCALFAVQIHITGHDYRTVADILYMNLQVLIPDPNATTGLERKYILHRRIHDWVNFKHLKHL